MGLSVCPHAIIGLRIPRSAIYGRERAKAFNHDMPSDWTVDPKSGRQLWVERDCVKAPFTGDTYNTLLGSFEIIDLTYERAETYCYVAVVIAEGPDGCERGGAKRVPLDFKTMATQIQQLRSIATEFGLWSDSEFGLWAASRVGY
jgi:hypothetical protein